ncbi:MAG: protein-glutamine gamma-glutamyltransferase [Solirubrobacteraceae bacterium]|nr:protein-glutamine gamma-glutamyltransferase [Solirubrobacteraceae bacterium]
MNSGPWVKLKNHRPMNFNTYFRFASYATVAAATLALFVAGGTGVWLAAAVAIVIIIARKLEGTRWQFSERAALIIILGSLPLFYVDWRLLSVYVDIQFLENGAVSRGGEVTLLAHLILFLSAVKLLQRKGDRDWFFLYLISFFEVLLAAGLSASPRFMATLVLYLLCALTTIVAFEIQKAGRKVTATQTRLLVPPDTTLFRKLPMHLWRRRYLETRRLPFVSLGLLFLIVVLALPFFLMAPRSASSALKRGGGRVSGVIGFSDSVTLGEIGQLKRNDEVVMHVRIEDAGVVPSASLRWRGVALDEFTGRSWAKSIEAKNFEDKTDDRGFFKLDTTEDVARLTAQTFLIEPIDAPVLFGARRILAIQGRLPFIRVDSEGAIQTRPHDQERLVYKVYSDTTAPSPIVLRADRMDYLMPAARYLYLPDKLDPRVGALAKDVTARAGARNGYDEARAIESYLRDNYQYSLDLKAGGQDPLADFLFRVRSGHCEYFSTAMAIMLRTRGIGSRVVNGFLPGEYNQAAGAYTVRQSDAHSWVEVYFPKTNSWVTFDPTPAAGRTALVRTGLAAQLSKYSEALELMWFQYVVGYDKQEQHSLATSLRKDLLDLRRSSSNTIDRARGAVPAMIRPVMISLAGLVGLMVVILLARRVRHFGWRRGLKIWRTGVEPESSRVDFYERLIALLERQGIKRESSQTPLEFASAVGASEALAITSAYNRVRFGEEKLSASERKQIEQLLSELERNRKGR